MTEEVFSADEQEALDRITDPCLRKAMTEAGVQIKSGFNAILDGHEPSLWRRMLRGMGDD